MQALLYLSNNVIFISSYLWVSSGLTDLRPFFFFTCKNIQVTKTGSEEIGPNFIKAVKKKTILRKHQKLAMLGLYVTWLVPCALITVGVHGKGNTWRLPQVW